MNSDIHIFKSSGVHLGFIRGEFLYSRDGEYLGWLEGDSAWNKNGAYRGKRFLIGGNNYILLNRLGILPVPKTPRQAPESPTTPSIPQGNITPIQLPIGLVDGF